ncbi:MAG: GYF domain-containing protein [Luteolibacter sp.]
MSANCVWFYTCEGERLGPVTFEELRTMTTDSSLDPRLDMVWKQPMDAWKPAGQIDGLFERPSVPTEAKGNAAARAEKKRPTSHQQTYRTLMGKNANWPGARRRSFLLVTPMILFAWQFALAAASPFLIKQFGQILMTGILPLASLVPLVAVIYFGLRRLANVGMSRWWYLAVFAPILNLWVGYRCFACPPGYAYHKKMDGPGFALALLYFFILLTGTLLLTDSLARLSGSHNGEALRMHFRDAIDTASSPKTRATAKATGLLSDF